MQSDAPFGDDVVVNALWDRWRIVPDEVAYATVGFGSWHWHARSASHGPLFITADAVASAPDRCERRPSAAELEWAYRVPLALEGRGMRIGRPPIPTMSAEVLAPIEDGWVLSAWPMLEGRATHDGTYVSARDAGAVLELVRALHDVPPHMFGERQRLESFRVPGVARLLELVDDAWSTPHAGPHAAAAEALLHRRAADIHGLARLHDDLARCAPPVDEWVVTHGEPHAANVVFTNDGPVLIDWDTVKVAPRERDLWMIAADGFAVPGADRDMLRLYRVQWDLDELTDYALRFADPDDAGPVGPEAWDDFVQYVERAAHV